ncbi:MAG: hypothetical protein ACJASL_004438 [Paraglaciecola sp.]|jgi:hypothetical protein
MQTLHFHHVGIPVNEKMPEMDYSESLKMYTTDYFANLYDIEWMYFDHDNTLPKIIKETPHVAYTVDNLLEAIKKKNCSSTRKSNRWSDHGIYFGRKKIN